MSKEKELQTAVATGAVTLGLAALAAPANAATFTVTNLNDTGAGSLRDAVASANATAGADVINFQAGLTGTITLTSGELSLYDAVDIQGPGAATITVSGNNASRVFYIYSTANAPIDVTISGLTITNGSDSDGGGAIIDWGENLTLDHVVVSNSTTDGAGGGVSKQNASGTLHILSSTISGNSAARGGGIYFYRNDAPADIQDSVISNNTASGSGGGIYFYSLAADLTIARTTISGNHADCCGGGIFLYDTDGGKLTIDHTTISGNTATSEAGGIYLYGPDDPITIVDSTISGNQAQYAGGILAAYLNSGLTLNFTTIAGNTATGDVGGVFLYQGGIALENSIIADNTSPLNNDVAGGGTFTLDYSLIEDPGGATLVQNAGAIVGQDPSLGPLQNNGGPTQTQLPAAGSVVIDAGDPAYAPPPADDQRGFARKSGTNVDMGAVEVNGGAMQFSSATYSVNENGASITITVTRTGGTDPATVNYATSNGSATSGADYTATSGTLNFIAGQTTATFNVPILDDNLVEGNETFNVALSSPSPGATLGAQATAVVTIVDVEPGVLQLSAPTYTVAENGGSVTITVNRTNGSTNAVAVTYTTSNGSATSGSDYTATNGTLNFAVGQTSATFNVPILDDNLVEGNETFNVTLTGPTNGATLGAQQSAVVTINDVEPGVLQLSAPTYNVAENGGSVTITVNRTNGSTNAVAVNYATSNGSATSGGDYTATSGTLNFAIGQTSATFNVPILDDTLVEGNETFNVTLSAPTNGATLGAQSSAVVTINDVENPGSVQFSAATTQVQENQGPLVITVTRTGGSDGTLTVNFATSNGTATAGSDYTATSGQVTFADGDTAPKTITIPITDDHVPEPPETFTVTLSGNAAIGNPATITATIIDPPAPIPLLGALGKMLLALFTAMTGLFVINRNRMLGVLFAILFVGATAVPAHAASAFKRQPRAGHYRGTLASIVTSGGTATIKLTNGQTAVVPVTGLHVIDRRGKHRADGAISDLAAGMNVKVVLQTNKAGQVVAAKVKIVNSPSK